ncbi:MAG TPA: sulfotransferase [Verrucomicrobiae bacterium]|nr:sulfotransferase [Verrucomicrobiae bacterium]
MRPTFIIVGAQKAGTTSLYHLLYRHPRIKPAKKKELHYFDNNYFRDQSWYESMFPLARLFFGAPSKVAKPITGEASPYYLFHPSAVSRMARTLPDAKLIVLLRNPVERAYSHYQHQVRSRTENLSFEDALASEKERIQGEAEKLLKDDRFRSAKHRRYSYLSRGIYAD